MEKANYVACDAAIYIWWASVWRLALAMIIFDISMSDSVLTNIPSLTKIIENSPVIFLLFYCFCRWVISLWAIRASLKNNYAAFTLIVENKETRRSCFNFDGQLNITAVISVWWARIWRTMLVPAVILFGNISAALVSHKSIIAAIELLSIPPLIYLCAFAAFLASIWATRESLADRYRSFRFITKPKNFYADGNNN